MGEETQRLTEAFGQKRSLRFLRFSSSSGSICSVTECFWLLSRPKRFARALSLSSSWTKVREAEQRHRKNLTSGNGLTRGMPNRAARALRLSSSESAGFSMDSAVEAGGVGGAEAGASGTVVGSGGWQWRVEKSSRAFLSLRTALTRASFFARGLTATPASARMRLSSGTLSCLTALSMVT